MLAAMRLPQRATPSQQWGIRSTWLGVRCLVRSRRARREGGRQGQGLFSRRLLSPDHLTPAGSGTRWASAWSRKAERRLSTSPNFLRIPLPRTRVNKPWKWPLRHLSIPRFLAPSVPWEQTHRTQQLGCRSRWLPFRPPRPPRQWSGSCLLC
jgi:hypothetical protein